MKELHSQDLRSDDPENLHATTIKEHVEPERLESAAEHISRMEQLRPEAWSKMSETNREWCLRQVGQRLSEVYECPAPPFIGSRLKEDDRGITLGEHSDSDYLIKLDHEVLKMNDPHRALETYCHEFRHAYQHEMASRYNSAFRHLCHNEIEAKRWSENLQQGKYASFEEDPERYAAQPVENDARDFAAKIREKVRTKQQ